MYQNEEVSRARQKSNILENCGKISVFFYDLTDSRLYSDTSQILEIKFYSFLDLLSEVGGFSKTIGLLLFILVGRAL